MLDSSKWNDKCDTYVLFDLLGKKWTIFIIFLLRNGHSSFSSILKILSKMNSKTLAERLKQLEVIGLVQVKVEKSNNRNTYHLTSSGINVSEHIIKLSSKHAIDLVKK